MKHLSPKQVGRALGVSESSVKRWCDGGEIAADYTPGGHRRIAVSTLIDYVRASQGLQIVDPAVLGLPATTGQTARVLRRAVQGIADALVEGREGPCREIVFDLYLAGHQLSTICDEVLAEAFREIGDRWECGEAEVYEERRGCEICLRVLHEIRTVLPAVPAEAPLALGAAPAQDRYSLPSTMVELVLRSAGWQAVTLGNNLPFETLSAAIDTHRPRLFWLSVSHIDEQSEFVEAFNRFSDAHRTQTAVVAGGRALDDALRGRLRYSAYCDTLSHLETFASELLR